MAAILSRGDELNTLGEFLRKGNFVFQKHIN